MGDRVWGCVLEEHLAARREERCHLDVRDVVVQRTVPRVAVQVHLR